jgi:type VII secretion protein EccE
VAHRVIAAELAAALLVAGVIGGPLWLGLAVPIAAVLLMLAFGRLRGRPLSTLIAQTIRFLSRRRALSVGASTDVLLELIRPGTVVSTVELDGTGVGVIEDADGLSAVIEVGNTTGLLGGAHTRIPPLTALLPPAGPAQPAVRLQLLLAGVAAPAARAGSTAAATSYRQLTEGRILAHQRLLISVRVRRAGGFADADLRRSLTAALRRARRRFERAQLPHRVLSAESVLGAVAELAHHEPGTPVREMWTGLELGGLRQVGFRISRWPDARSEFGGELLTRLLTLPCSGTTISVAAQRGGRAAPLSAELVIRLAAPTGAALGNATAALLRLVETAGASVTRLDGAQFDALAATLPLGGGTGGAGIVLDGLIAGRTGLTIADSRPVRIVDAALDALEPALSGEGLMLGVNRKQEPVVVRLFRPEPTRAALIGGLRCAETVVLRALAVGARVIVQSARPHAWEPFLRGLSGGEQAVLVPPGQVMDPPAATPVQPQLLVIDVGPLGATGVPAVESAWRATLLVRDELTPADTDILARADLALLQPLAPHEAALAAAALGLGDAAGWLTRIRADMLGVVVDRRTVRWALVSSTPIERQLIGAATR